jgi:hypothetical protein
MTYPKVFAMASMVALGAAVASADPVTLNFNSLTQGEYTTGSTVGIDDGFVIKVLVGPAYVGEYNATYGNSLEAEQPDNGSTAPIYQISMVNGGDFTLSSWDFLNYSSGSNSQNTQTVTGYLNGTQVGSDSFTTTNNSFNTYANTGFAGVEVNAVDFTVFPEDYQKALDNVVVNSSVPDGGGTIAMFGAALAGLAVTRRRTRRSRTAA